MFTLYGANGDTSELRLERKLDRGSSVRHTVVASVAFALSIVHR